MLRLITTITFLFGAICILYSQTVSIVSDNDVCKSELVSFQASTTGAAASFSWTFSDGSSSNQQNPLQSFTQIGTIAVSLSVTFSNGSTATASKNIQVHDLPTADFSFANSEYCFSIHSLCLTDNSDMGQTTNGYQSRLVLWGNGDTSQTTTPSSQSTFCYSSYSTPGTYSMVIEVVNDKGCEDKWQNTITILPDYIPSFRTVAKVPGCKSIEYCFLNDSSTKPTDVVQWEYDFGDGTTSLNGDWGQQCHTYTTEGTFKIYFKTTLSNGCVNLDSTTISYSYPKFNFDVQTDDSIKCHPEPFNFTNPVLNSADYTWILYDVDTNVVGVSGKNVAQIVKIPCPGKYFVRLKLRLGSCDSFSRYVSINSQGNLPLFIPLNGNQCQAMDTMFFINQSKYHPDSRTSILWRFDDDSASNCTTYLNNCRFDINENSKHFFADTGCFNVSLILTDSVSGCIDSFSRQVNIQDVAKAEFYHKLESPCIGIRPEYRVAFESNLCNAKVQVVYDSLLNDSIFKPLQNLVNYFDVADSNGWVTVGFAVTTGDARVYRSADTTDYYIDSSRLCRDTLWYHNWFQLHPEPDLNFNFSPDGLCLPVNLTMEYLGTNEKSLACLKYTWGDGDTVKTILLDKDTIPNFNHVYKQEGYYDLYVFLQDTFGCYAYTYPSQLFGYENGFEADTQICAGQMADIEDKVRYYGDNYPYWDDGLGLEKMKWNFDDGNGWVDSLHNPPFIFQQNGKYFVQLATEDANGCKDTVGRFINVGGIKAGIKKPKGEYLCDQIIQLFDSSYFTIQGSDTVKEYYWDFGDFKDPNTLKDPFHYYSTNGYFTLTHAVKTEAGCTDTARIQIYLRGPEPYFDIVSDTVGCVPFTATFTSTSKFVSQFVWSMGDSAQTVISGSSDTTFSFTYNKPGVYDIFLRGADSFYNADANNTYTCQALFPDSTQRQYPRRRIIVLPIPKVNFDFQSPVCANQPVDFVAMCDTIYTQFAWSVDDQSLDSTTSVVTTTFDSAGTYDVWLKPWYIPQGPYQRACFDSIVKQIVVSNVEADFSFIEKGDCSEFFFTQESTNGIAFKWDFDHPAGKNNITEEENPSHYYGKDTGTFNVCLIAINNLGCEDTVCKPIRATYSELLIPYNVFTPGNDGKNDEYLVDIFNYREFRLQIFNRWGERIFETADPSVGWNGNDINGKQLPSSTYYYILDYAFTCDEDTSRVEGIVEMIRER